MNGITNGTGTLSLRLVDDGSIKDLSGNPLVNSDGTPAFPRQATFAAGNTGHANAVTAADVNGDGKPDLIVTNHYGVGVLLGNANGTFQTQATFATGNVPSSVDVADINGDGKPDLIVTNSIGRNSNYPGASLSVLLANGDGTFQNQATFATGWYPFAVAVEDLNGDGAADIVVPDFSGNSVSLLLGNGNGTFQNQRTFAAGVNPRSVAVVDVNGDRHLDLVVANTTSGSASVLLGNGDGTFQAQQTFAAGSQPLAIAAADVNGDGKSDALVVDAYRNAITALLSSVAADVTSPAYVVTPAPATQLVFLQSPSIGTAGQLLSPAVSVAVEDQFGRVVTGDASTVTLCWSQADPARSRMAARSTSQW